jgi:hypothetical protein
MSAPNTVSREEFDKLVALVNAMKATTESLQGQCDMLKISNDAIVGIKNETPAAPATKKRTPKGGVTTSSPNTETPIKDGDSAEKAVTSTPAEKAAPKVNKMQYYQARFKTDAPWRKEQIKAVSEAVGVEVYNTGRDAVKLYISGKTEEDKEIALARYTYNILTKAANDEKNPKAIIIMNGVVADHEKEKKK